MTENKAVEKFGAWLREQIAGRSSFKIPDLVKKAEKHFGNDAQFLRAFAADTLHQHFYQQIQKALHRMRADVVDLGGVYARPDMVTVATSDTVKSVWGRWSNCFEYLGERHMLVLDMGARELAEAESARFERADDIAKWGKFFAQVRKGMKPGKKVRDCFTPAKLDEIWEEITVKSNPQSTSKKGAA